MKKIGLLGGTFNPPHMGHLMMANEVFHALQLDEVRFMPNALPPHKEKRHDVSDTQRLAMVQHAIQPYAHFSLESYEVEKGGVSYSYDTLSALCAREPDVEFYFIIGGDMIDSLHTWYRIEDLLALVKFVGVKRPQTVAMTAYPIIMVDAPQIDLSSTLLRERFATHSTVTFLVPETVEAFIRQEGLYGA
ncbi:nicotinate-nucleotide adenylyltransferase [Lysinibacillus piscis]|uniref:Probable nicotinate-nucleotide adenylyltransferase n=1 Tax=Lysinibacillus piscis TaxID=2518931 RepID=A0ABQ5NJH6_9BACI|nr:nicotinate-nucleotide adenylyltransferase [Lysinibacillus sp. KH24]GLC88527.1 putative nicotinate-nucleotide adenylyltransferase [Lysinibacillus sp. KH24]